VRNEVTGKQTIVGAYAGEMIINIPAPATLPNLAVLINYRDDPDTFPKTVIFRIYVETAKDDNLVWEHELEMKGRPELPGFTPKEEQKMFAEARIGTAFPGITFTEESRMKVRAYIGEDEYRLGALFVRFKPDEPASAAAN
jgi:hypothetical protein